MGSTTFYCGGTTDAIAYASEILEQDGILFGDSPGPEITDVLLDVPSFQKHGILRSGKNAEELFRHLGSNVRVWGGKLSSLEFPCRKIDLLEDSQYVAENAAITADCAIRLCGLKLDRTWSDCRVLVIGWGRIGKNLCTLLRDLGAQVTVCARKAPDRALLSAFGYQVTEPALLNGNGYQVIFNTAPAEMMTSEAIGDCPLPIDLASVPGLIGEQVIWARGLPGIYAPISSGKLIAHTILKYLGR